MLKLYYDGFTEPLVIGGLDYSKYYKDLISQNPYNSDATGYDKCQEINGVDNNFKRGSGFNALAKFETSERTERKVPMFLDPELQIPTFLTIGFVDSVKGYTNFGKRISFYFSAVSGLHSADVKFWEMHGYKNRNIELYSPYLSKNSEDTIEQMCINMLAAEVEIASGGITNVSNEHFSGLQQPFIPISAANDGVATWIAYLRNAKGDEVNICDFMNAVNVHYMLTKRQLLTTSLMTLADGSSYRPAMAYRPDHFNDLVYQFGEVDSIGDYSYGYDEGLIVDDYTVETTTESYSTYNLTELSSMHMPFIQLPSKIYFQQKYEDMKTVYGLIDSGQRTRYWGWTDFITKTNDYGSNNGVNSFILVTTCTSSIKNYLLNNLTNNIVYDTNLGFIPRVTLAFNSNNYKNVAVFTAENVGKRTGQQWIDTLFSGNTDAEDSQYSEPTISDNIPNISESNFGGKSDESSVGGNGTWKASDDDTTIDFTKDDLAEDPNSPLPDGVFDDLNGNVYYVKLNSAQFSVLCDDLWVDNDNAFLRFLKETTGQAQINAGVISAKTSLLNIKTTGTAKITTIAGYALPQEVGCSRFNQYQRFSFGSVNVEKVFDNFLDYQAQILLSLPFAGDIQIPAEVCMGKTLNLGLTVDVITGNALYSVQCENHMLAEVPANIFIDIPLSTSDYNESGVNVISGIFRQNANNVSNMGSQIANGHLQDLASLEKLGRNVAKSTKDLGVYGDMMKTVGKDLFSGASGSAGFATAAIQFSASAATTVTEYDESRNLAIVSSGGGPGSVGFLGNHYAVLKISRPYVRIDDDYYHFNGAPSDIITTLGECKGYTEVGDLIPAESITDEELEELREILMHGVFF